MIYSKIQAAGGCRKRSLIGIISNLFRHGNVTIEVVRGPCIDWRDRSASPALPEPVHFPGSPARAGVDCSSSRTFAGRAKALRLRDPPPALSRAVWVAEAGLPLFAAPSQSAGFRPFIDSLSMAPHSC